MRYVYPFDHRHKGAPRQLAELLGGKGANLAEMTSVLELPVPPGFTVSTTACRAYLRGGWPDGLDEEVAKHLARLEKATGKRLGDAKDPMLVSVRSGARFSMPGMMDTVLDLGLNDLSVEGLAAQTNDERFALDSYRRFIALYSRIVTGLEAAPFEQLLEEAKRMDGVGLDSQVTPATLRWLCDRYKAEVQEVTGSPFEQDPSAQLRRAIEAVFSSWNGPRAVAYREREAISHDLGTAVNVQTMVFGNRNDNSGTGVGFTRDPSTGENRVVADFLQNAQGEDVVAGIRQTADFDALRDLFPKIHRELVSIFSRLEAHYRDMCDTEFTIEDGRLFMLQTRVGKRTGAAAVRMAVEMTAPQGRRRSRWKISRHEALLRVKAEHLESVLHPQFVSGRGSSHGQVIATGLGASPGAAVGKVYFTADAAADAAERGERVILVRTETSPEDVHGMMVAEGILTARGGLVSHAAVVARGWGKPAVVGAEAIEVADHCFTAARPAATAAELLTVNEGEVISLDGATGEVVLGELAVTVAPPPPEFETLLGWADEVRKGKLGVRANADNASDAAVARSFGAEGIGLCRTEHMFLADDRLPTVRRMILAPGGAEESAALDELHHVQKADFESILEAMDGLPVTVRLLDPPLHEFLPSTAELAVKQASTGLDDGERALLVAAQSWEESNPMLGTRGVRLAVLKPGLYSMQVRALVEAAGERIRKGGRPIVEVMVPLVVTGAEMALARTWVTDALAAASDVELEIEDIDIGTMIETPRAAVRAGEVAAHADFFSFGTNDLTQMTFGFSRDDVEGRMMAAYLEQGLLPSNPFETIDVEGVGELVTEAVLRGRGVRPGLKIGVCGEHGGDPKSIEFFVGSGLDYVSCSPYRVPIARLAAAQALLSDGAENRAG